MKKTILIFGLFIAYCTSLQNAFAVDTYTNASYTIARLVFYSEEQSLYPHMTGLVRAEFTETISWIGGTCHMGRVVIRNEDEHLISALLTAKATGEKINLYADDAFKAGSYCYLRALSFD